MPFKEDSPGYFGHTLSFHAHMTVVPTLCIAKATITLNNACLVNHLLNEEQ